MEGGKLAALFLDEAIKQGNYDEDVMKIYHQRWMNKFGFDFKWWVVKTNTKVFGHHLIFYGYYLLQKQRNEIACTS